MIGHKNIIHFLETSLANDNLAHAYLFYGSAQLGKTTLARHFIKSILCQAKIPPQNLPCEDCPSCRQFEKGIYPDFYLVEREEDKKNISIAQIRDLEHKLHVSSFLNAHKIALIKEAENLSEEAANGLLKTLEEPQSKTIIILLAEKVSHLPSTIISRCQRLKFLNVSRKEILDYLLEKGLERKRAENLASLAEGRPGVALNFFYDNIAYLDYQKLVRQFFTIAESNIQKKFKEINKIANPQKLLNIWLALLRDIFLIKNGADNFINHLFAQKDLEKLALKYSNEKLKEKIKEIKKTKIYLSQNVNPRLALENLALNI